MNKIFKQLFLIAIIPSCFSQNDTSTPYSMFGLGVENKTASGGLTGMGNAGIAQNNSGEINLFNPASLSNIQQKSFLYEFGLNGIYSSLKTDYLKDNTSDYNISHVVMAFPLKKNLGMSFGLLPYTKVGYDIDVENSIEGSTDTYISRITGAGGLSKAYLSTGFNVTDGLSLGVDLSFLFGSISEETNLYYESFVNITDVNYYNGVKLKTGFQLNLVKQENKEITLGGVIELPAKLTGDKVRNSTKNSTSGTEIIVDEDIENTLDDFELPLAFGLGLTAKLNQSLTTSFDFKKLLWNNTNQLQNNERYTDQSIYAFGAEYLPKTKNTYWSNVKYRFGVNYNTGFLTISNQKIDSYFASAGLGLPLSNKAKLNISYSYGREGTLTNNLIQENFHKLTINLSLIGNWFNKRKYQ
ncbi:outer membrane protein transport protein [Seonamhaeicola sp. MEBiC1930]|uniref:OmpP1/FadL family transporter n=1 Tax=Seonamhaeicola sp. MEBiC01930 TaxID=2976768 RepID=UPI003254D62C